MIERVGARVVTAAATRRWPAVRRRSFALAAAATCAACSASPGSAGPSAGGAAGDASPSPSLVTAPESARVDTATPVFSRPTEITNPLFPISALESVVLLGTVERLPFRTETTLLPETKVIQVAGKPVETAVSQYVAFLDGQITEVALDFYAQADDGSVWYLGEDVVNYEDGAVADTEGTWLAGKEGPAAMIMPADPRPGDVYRPENAPSIVFEEVTVRDVGRTVTGPLGPVPGAIVVEELHMDGSTEGKVFAPGYGEFLTGAGGELEAVAVATRQDAVSQPLPPAVAARYSQAVAVYDAARTGEWPKAARAVATLQSAGQVGAQPRMVDAAFGSALVPLVAAVDARQPSESARAALDVARVGLDYRLRYQPVTEVDLARFGLWARSAALDADGQDGDRLSGDVVALSRTWDRCRHDQPAATRTAVDQQLQLLADAAESADFAAAADAAQALLRAVDR